MNLAPYLPLVLIVIVGYLLMIRPARKRARAVTELQAALSSGDEVMLTSGLFATVVDVRDEIARVELAPGIVVRVHRKAVGQVIVDLPPTPEAGEYPGDETPGVN